MLAVSIIITVYNGAEYLKECLDSILAQTLQSREIICVDDASTDSTPQILETYEDKITIITNTENCMAGESRNRGFQKAVGEYVIFLDADDVYEPDMLQKAYEKAKSVKADICIFREDLFSDSIEKRTNYAYAESVMQDLGERDFFSPKELAGTLFSLWNGWAWDKLFRREFIVEAGLRFQKLRSTNDGFFVHAAMASAEKISLLNEVLVHHRTGNGNSVSNTRDRAWESCLIYLRELRQNLLLKGLFSVYEKSYLNWTLDFLYWNYQTLQDRSRKALADAIRQFYTEELIIRKYDRRDFYNEFFRWTAERFIRKEESMIPITEEERFRKTYRLNKRKIEALQKYLAERGWKSVLWGAGIRGRAFAEIYGPSWSDLLGIYDMDRSKQGKELAGGLMVLAPDALREEKATCILTLNSAHVLSVLKIVGKENKVLFDMNTYLNFPDEIEDCMI